MTTITTRSGKGSPLTNDEVDANFTNLNTDKVETSGDSMTGDLSFGDNNKAIFGAGSDLQIYHTPTGNHSIITESGSGNLILAADNLEINNAANNANKIVATTGGAVTLFHNNSAKLATSSTGIDISGTVVSDGLTVSGPSVTATLNASGTNSGLEFTHGSTNTAVRDWSIRSNTEAFGDFIIRRESSYGSGVDTKSMAFASNGNISFYEDTGSTAKLTWSASNESLTFGTNLAITTNEIDVATGDLTLDVAGDIILDADGAQVRFKDAGTEFFKVSNESGFVQLYSPVSNSDIKFDGNDGGSAITALTLDMSAAGAATFNAGVTAVSSTISSTHPTLMLKTSGGGDTDQAYVQKYNNDLYVYNKESSGNLYLGTNNTTKITLGSAGGLTTSPTSGGHAVFNETGVDADFRVESDSDANMLFVDGGANKVAVGTSSPQQLLHLNSSAITYMRATGGTGNTGIDFGQHSSGTGYIWHRDDAAVIIGTNSTERVRFGSSTSGETTFNEGGDNFDFRVESNGNANMLFVDAGNDRVGIGRVPSISNSKLEVGGADNVSLINVEASGVTGGMGIGASGLQLFHGTSSKLAIASSGAATFSSTIASAGVTSSNSITMTAGNMSLNSTSDGNQAFRYYRADGTLVVQQYPYNNRFNVQTYNNQGLRLKSDGSGQIELEGNVVINEDSANVDFRVESNGNTHALFVDAGNNRVGIGTGAPSYEFVVSKDGSSGIEFGPEGINSTTSFIQFYNRSTAVYDTGRFYGSGFQWYLNAAQTGMTLSTTSLVVNESGANSDFRVESNGNAHMLFVDGGTNRVHVATSGVGPSNFNVLNNMAITNQGGAQYLLMGNQDSAGVNNPNVIASGNGVLSFGNGNSWSSSTGGTLTETFRMGTTEVVANESSRDQDFRVESDNYSHAFFVQASNGRVNIGDATVPNQALHVSTNANTTEPMGVNDSGANGAVQKHRISFKYQTTEVGSIKANNSATTFNTSSDARLKENIVDADDAGELIDGIQVRQFDWIIDGEHQRYGMVAQELNTVAPEAVSEGETEEDMMGVDYSKLVPMLVKEIQSLRARVAQLESN
ncbi:tail fiber domain-containing protein [bacterium]|nr:tail fiber domain-containing protein [bacterium]